jgi:F-type H+-transporting ATPase subunit b
MAQTTHTETPSKPSFPPFEPEFFVSQLFWLVITFVALYALMAKLVLPRLGGIIDARRNSVEGDLAQAARHRKDADAALAAYEQALSEARNRAQTVANETRDRLHAQSEKARHELEAKLNIKLADAERTIATTRNAAMANVKSIAADAAAAIVQRLTGSAPAAAAVESAVADALKR